MLQTEVYAENKGTVWHELTCGTWPDAAHDLVTFGMRCGVSCGAWPGVAHELGCIHARCDLGTYGFIQSHWYQMWTTVSNMTAETGSRYGAGNQVLCKCIVICVRRCCPHSNLLRLDFRPIRPRGLGKCAIWAVRRHFGRFRQIRRPIWC